MEQVFKYSNTDACTQAWCMVCGTRDFNRRWATKHCTSMWCTFFVLYWENVVIATGSTQMDWEYTSIGNLRYGSLSMDLTMPVCSVCEVGTSTLPTSTTTELLRPWTLPSVRDETPVTYTTTCRQRTSVDHLIYQTRECSEIRSGRRGRSTKKM